MNLYIVATPIGNLEDITLRALRVLKEVDGIISEDTRVTRKLIDRYGIKTSLFAYHARSGNAAVKKIISLLNEGKNLALVSDAGTPAISDPGAKIISEGKKIFGKDLKIIPVPGASALTAAFSASGFSGSEFLFLGFLPHKKGRETLFKEIALSKRPVIFYESPHRVLKTLISLEHFVPKRNVLIAREMTKIYESFIEGAPKEISAYFRNNPEEVRGEFVVIVSTASSI